MTFMCILIIEFTGHQLDENYSRDLWQHPAYNNMIDLFGQAHRQHTSESMCLRIYLLILGEV